MHRFRRCFSLRVLILVISCLVTGAKASDEEHVKRVIKNTFESYVESDSEKRLDFFSRTALLKAFRFAYLVADPNKKIKGLARARKQINQIDGYEIENYDVLLTPHPQVKVRGFGKWNKNAFLLVYSFVQDSDGVYRIDDFTIKRDK